MEQIKYISSFIETTKPSYTLMEWLSVSIQKIRLVAWS